MTYDLIEILEERYSPSEIVELLNDFDESKLKDYAIEHDVCIKCYGNLVIHRYKEDRGEFWGFPCSEEMSELICECCNSVYPD